MKTIPLLILLFGFTNAISQDFYDIYKTEENDSVLLAKFIRQMEFEMVNWEEQDSFTTQEAIDSVLGTWQVSYLDGKVYQPDDGAFKIYTVEGEGCGAYCNPFWESFVKMKSGKYIFDMPFTNITAIHILTDGKYLLIEETYTRPAGFYTTSNFTVVLFSVNKDSITFHPVQYNYPYWGENIDEYTTIGSLSFFQPHYLDAEQYMYFDTTTYRLYYQYADDPALSNGFNDTAKAEVFTGYFEYINGELILQEEKAEEWSPGEED